MRVCVCENIAIALSTTWDSTHRGIACCRKGARNLMISVLNLVTFAYVWSELESWTLNRLFNPTINQPFHFNSTFVFRPINYENIRFQYWDNHNSSIEVEWVWTLISYFLMLRKFEKPSYILLLTVNKF